jgi:DnaJ-domain-containing protein 1
MAKIDEIKEFLNSLRVFFTVVIALMVAIGGGLLGSHRQNIYDVAFWFGFACEIVLALIAIIIIRKIKTKTREIGEL